jgi:hypothetical protein
MQLIELGLQGVRGLPNVARLSLGPGLNVAVAADPAVRQALMEALRSALFFEPSKDPGLSGLIAPDSETARIALTYDGIDGARYRMIRDAASGSATLQRSDPSSGKFGPFLEGAQAAAHLRAQEHLPERKVFERIFVLRPPAPATAKPRDVSAPVAPGMPAGRAPSARGPVAARTGSLPGRAAAPQLTTSSPRLANALARAEEQGLVAGGPPKVDPLTEAYASGSIPPVRNKETLMAELRQVKEQLDLMRRAEEGRRQLDKIDARQSELKRKTELARALSGEIAELEERSSNLVDVSSLPADMRDRMRAFDTASDKREAELAKLDEDLKAAEGQLHEAFVRPLKEDYYFLGGLLGMLLMLLLAFSLGRAWIAFGNLLGAVVAAGALFRYISELERAARAKAKISAITDKGSRIEKQFEAETGAVKRLMAQVGVQDTMQMIHSLDDALDVRALKAEKQAAFQALLEDGDLASAVSELGKLDARANELENFLAGVEATTGVGATLLQLEARAASLERELGGSAGSPTEVEDDGVEGYGYSTRGAPASDADGSSALGMMLAPSDPGSRGGSRPSAPVRRFSSGPAVVMGEPPDLTREIVAAGGELFQTPPPTFGAAIAARLGKYLAALTEGRFASVEIGSGGEVKVVGTAGSEAYGALDPSGKRALEAAIQLSIVEACVTRLKTQLPLLIDDALTALDARGRGVFQQMLNALAEKQVQILVVTPAQDLEGHRVRW